jgi:AraC family transcriptional regulator, transcriptional activator of pobA
VKQIPQYHLDERHRPLHRVEGEFTPFGNNVSGAVNRVKDFELYSSDGLRMQPMGPFRCDFYRIGLVLRGSCHLQMGLEHFIQTPGTVNCSFPNQVFSKTEISPDIFGYYVLFNTGFLDDLITDARMAEEFPFFSYGGTPFFPLEAAVVSRAEDLLRHMDAELHMDKVGREKAIRMYLYLLLLELKRSYRDQSAGVAETAVLVMRFRKLVGEHYLMRQRVADYAGMLHITPNHLNRIVKEVSGRTASDHIAEMILQEAKILLNHTDLSAAEIAYRLRFSEPSSFNRFFRKGSGQTPVEYRIMAASGQ